MSYNEWLYSYKADKFAFWVNACCIVLFVFFVSFVNLSENAKYDKAKVDQLITKAECKFGKMWPYRKNLIHSLCKERPDDADFIVDSVATHR